MLRDELQRLVVFLLVWQLSGKRRAGASYELHRLCTWVPMAFAVLFTLIPTASGLRTAKPKDFSAVTGIGDYGATAQLLHWSF